MQCTPCHEGSTPSRRDDPEQLAWAFAYLADTWEAPADAGPPPAARSGEVRRRAQDLTRALGCEPMMASSPATWERYAGSARVILGEEAREVLLPCDRRLVERWSSNLAKVRARLDAPQVVRLLDDALGEAPGELGDGGLDLWMARLERHPAPPPSLVDAIDRTLIDSIDPVRLLKRLEREAPLSEANAARLLDALRACCAHHPFVVQVVTAPQLAGQREALDAAILDAAEASPLAPESLYARVAASTEVPLSPAARSRLDAFLPPRLEDHSGLALGWLRVHPVEAERDALVARLDRIAAEGFRREVFASYLRARLQLSQLPPLDEGVRQALLAEARAMAKETDGFSFDTHVCMLLRAVLGLEAIHPSRCRLPDDFLMSRDGS